MADGNALLRVLLIAGSDSSSGAGVQRDLRVLADNGVQARCAVTAITAQTDTRVADVHFVPTNTVAQQIACALEEGVDAVKIGMLGRADIVRAVAGALEGCAAPIVIDPVLVSSSGGALLDAEGRALLLELLSPRACLLTPNLPEAVLLLDGIEVSAAAVSRIARCPVLLKGGHGTSEKAIDQLYADGMLHSLEGPRLAARMRGTGCALSTAIAARLALGHGLLDACRQAKGQISRLLAGSVRPRPGGKVTRQ